MFRRTFLTAVPLGLGLTSRAAAIQEGPPITGRMGRGLERFDHVMRGLMGRHAIPGGSLSLAKDGRLVYARGFGWAQLEPRVPAQPGMLFGLASVSKAITAVAALKLVDKRELDLDNRAFAILSDFLPRDRRPIDPRVREITVRMLLNHSAGYKQQPNPQQVAHAFDLPVAKLREDHMVRFFADRPLDFDPGTEQHYSNFGFTVLGAVVARIAREPYGEAVHRLVLRPLGIRRPRLGHGEPYGPEMAHRYNEQGRELPPINIPGGPAGGWIASSVDLVRLLCALNGARGPRFLSPETIQAMLAPPDPPLHKRPGNAWFGLGWDVVRQTPHGPLYAKNGGMPGVRTFIGHASDGTDWAVLFNGGRDFKGQPNEDADAFQQLQQAIRQTTDWPESDLFDDFR